MRVMFDVPCIQENDHVGIVISDPGIHKASGSVTPRLFSRMSWSSLPRSDGTGMNSSSQRLILVYI